MSFFPEDPMTLRLLPALLIINASAVLPVAVTGQPHGLLPEDEQVLQVAEAALRAISAEDMVALTDLMVEGTVVWSVTEDGVVRRTRAEEREMRIAQDFVERGFDPEVRRTGNLATVWVPYDFHVNGAWSHCGVDTFTMVKVEGEWRIAGMAWTVEQPPACRPHPEGPPGG
jgi:hypothetical protein